MDSKNQKLQLPALSQVGVVVKDVEKAVEFYSKTFGIGPFTTTIFEPEKHWVNGKPYPVKLKIAFAPMGPVTLELIEPLSESPHKEFLDSRGEGLQHLGFYIDNYDEWMSYLRQQGIGILYNAECDVEGMGHIRAAYMDTQTGKPGNILIELLEVKPAQ
jgi:catechol 2,3-dioxygenase-like lactoylglutathione lyase family enzyme